jgi:hypothetical protein
MSKPKLTLVHDNTELNTYYVPFTIMQVDFFPVKATSPEQAIMKANQGQFERLEKRVTLEETKTNAVYESLDIPTDDVLVRNVDFYEIKEKSFDEVMGTK